MTSVPRLRMIAGPNGAGKSTIKAFLPPELLGVYINPDEIEKAIREYGCRHFNSRWDTLTRTGNHYWHGLLESKRCLIPADGFYVLTTGKCRGTATP